MQSKTCYLSPLFSTPNNLPAFIFPGFSPPFLSLLSPLMASAACASPKPPTTTTTTVSGPTRRRLQDFDPEKLPENDQDQYEDDDNTQSQFLRLLFSRKNNNNKGTRLPKSLWRNVVMLLLFFLFMAFFGGLNISQIGVGIGERTSLLHQMTGQKESLSLIEEEEKELNLTSLRLSTRRKSEVSRRS